MIIFNGKVYSNLNGIAEESVINLVYTFPIEERVRVEGGKIIFWEEHYFRIMSSLRILRMEIPMLYTMEYLEEQILILLKEMKLVQVSSIVCLSFFSTELVSRATPVSPTSFLIKAYHAEIPVHVTSNRSIDLFKDHYVVKGLFGSLESSNARLRELASVYVYENDLEDGIFLNDQKEITETLKGALFVVKENKIKTPPLSSGCRSSVYRQIVIDLLQKSEDTNLVEETLSPFELQKADEMFVVSLSEGIQSVKRYRKKTFNTEISRKLFYKFINNYRLG